MQTAMIKDLPKGEFFNRKPDANKVYRREEYCRINKAYQCDDESDISRALFLKGTTVVYYGFEY